MHVAAKIAIGAGIVGVGALALVACGGPKEQDAESFGLKEFGKFDKNKDNKWGSSEIEQSWIHTRTQEVNTWRIGDYIHGTRQILQRTSTDSMRRIFEAAKGNDAVLSLQEMSDFARNTYDADKNDTLNKDERKAFKNAYGVTSTSTREVLIGSEPFMRYSPRSRDNYPTTGGSGGTSHGDERRDTSDGDENGGYIPPPPSNGGGYTPPPSNGGGSGNPEDSTDNGNPPEDYL